MEGSCILISKLISSSSSVLGCEDANKELLNFPLSTCASHKNRIPKERATNQRVNAQTITPCGQESTWSTTSHGFIDSSVEELWTLARIEMSVTTMPASLSQWAAEPSPEEEILLQTSAPAIQLS